MDYLFVCTVSDVSICHDCSEVPCWSNTNFLFAVDVCISITSSAMDYKCLKPTLPDSLSQPEGYELSWAESGKDLAEPFHVFLEALLFFPELGFWIQQERHCSLLHNCHHSSSWVTPNMPIRFNEALFIQTTHGNASLFQLLYPQAKLPVTRRSEFIR